MGGENYPLILINFRKQRRKRVEDSMRIEQKRSIYLLENGILLILIALLVMVVLFQANPMVNYPSRDGGTYTYIGNLILKGKIPYLAAWEPKPPGIFYLNALGLWMGHGTRWGIWLLEFIFLFGATIAGFQLMRKLWTFSAAIFGTSIWLLGLNRLLSSGNYTEQYSLLFNFIALYAFWRTLQEPKKWIYDFIIGLTLACSFLFRPNNIGVQISLALSLLVISVLHKQFKLFLSKMVIWGIAGSLVLGIVAVYFWTQHALIPLIKAVFLYNFSYTGSHADLLAGVKFGFIHLGIPAWVAFIGFLCALVLIVQMYRKNHGMDVIHLLLVIGWPVEMFLSSISGRGYGHYFISWLPIIALLAGFAFSSLSPLVFNQKLLDLFDKKSSLVLAASILLVFVLFRAEIKTYQISFERVLFQRSAGVERISPISTYIRNNSDPGDKVFVWAGELGINYMSKRESPTAYIWYPLYVDSPYTPNLVNGFFYDINSNKPEMIIDASIDSPDDVPAIDQLNNPGMRTSPLWISSNVARMDLFSEFIENNYYKEAVEDGYTVYRLKQ
jgi:hypothetical protein